MKCMHLFKQGKFFKTTCLLFSTIFCLGLLANLVACNNSSFQIEIDTNYIDKVSYSFSQDDNGDLLIALSSNNDEYVVVGANKVSMGEYILTENKDYAWTVSKNLKILKESTQGHGNTISITPDYQSYLVYFPNTSTSPESLCTRANPNAKVISEIKNLVIPATHDGKTVTCLHYDETVSSGAFSGCSSLVDVTFKEPCTLVQIEKFAFAFDVYLSRITIPSSVVDIGTGAFSHCSSLKEVTVDSNFVASTTGDIGDLFANATTVFVNSNLTAGSFITTNFSLQSSSHKSGYSMYTK